MLRITYHLPSCLVTIQGTYEYCVSPLALYFVMVSLYWQKPTLTSILSSWLSFKHYTPIFSIAPFLAKIWTNLPVQTNPLGEGWCPKSYDAKWSKAQEFNVSSTSIPHIVRAYKLHTSQGKGAYWQRINNIIGRGFGDNTLYQGLDYYRYHKTKFNN